MGIFLSGLLGAPDWVLETIDAKRDERLRKAEAQGSEIKCYRTTHVVGREPIERERPCTRAEIEAVQKEAERMGAAQRQLKRIEAGQYLDPCGTGGKWENRPVCRK